MNLKKSIASFFLLSSFSISANYYVPQVLADIHKTLGVIQGCKDKCYQVINRDISEQKLKIRLLTGKRILPQNLDAAQEMIITGGVDNNGRGCAIGVGYGSDNSHRQKYMAKELTFYYLNDNGETNSVDLYKNTNSSIFETGYATETRNSLTISDPRYAFAVKDRDTLSLKSSRGKITLSYKYNEKFCTKTDGVNREDFTGHSYTKCLEKEWRTRKLKCIVSY